MLCYMNVSVYFLNLQNSEKQVHVLIKRALNNSIYDMTIVASAAFAVSRQNGHEPLKQDHDFTVEWLIINVEEISLQQKYELLGHKNEKITVFAVGFF